VPPPPLPVPQIRVHLAHAGHAILGDDLYGVTGGGSSPESALHLSFTHLALPCLADKMRSKQAGQPADSLGRERALLLPVPLPPPMQTAGPWIGRHALHAAAVTIQHPRTGVPLTVRAPLPPDFLDAMAQLGLQAPSGTGSLDDAGSSSSSSAGAGIR
jgi:23S rRNA-/tRNA-specific pseudouridylate synthase